MVGGEVGLGLVALGHDEVVQVLADKRQLLNRDQDAVEVLLTHEQHNHQHLAVRLDKRLANQCGKEKGCKRNLLGFVLKRRG